MIMMISSIHDFLILNCYRQGDTFTPAFRISRTYVKSNKFFRIGELGITHSICEAVDWYYIEHLKMPDCSDHRNAKHLALQPDLESCYSHKLANIISNHQEPSSIVFQTDYIHNCVPLFIKMQCRKVVRSYEYTLALQIPIKYTGSPIKATKIPHTIDDYFKTLTAYIAKITHELHAGIVNHFYVNHLYITAKFLWFDEMAKRNAFIEKKLISERDLYDHNWCYQQINDSLSILASGGTFADIMPKRKRVLR